MSALVFPASLRSAVEGAVKRVIDDHQQGKLPEFAYDRTEAGELEVVIRSAEPPEVVVDFDALRIESQPLSRTDKVRRILGEAPYAAKLLPESPPFRQSVEGMWADEQPVAAHGVAEEDGA